MRILSLSALLAAMSSTAAQSPPPAIPDTAQCSTLMAPLLRPLSPTLANAVNTTLQAYQAQGQCFFKLSNATTSDRAYLSGLRGEVNTYAGRLLRSRTA
ncbi:hypothetical protein GCM10008955_41630 [Deinococcus malanensis]|uniref:Uncharacterized protein n=1 Tax=Deinococcus malanensis TaxID=1706855 RepID=A0ABQ2F2Q6_9DEIO|nr:hypothetical protein GCM10008955_41630 [Deinococcus malanensis]